MRKKLNYIIGIVVCVMFCLMSIQVFQKTINISKTYGLFKNKKIIEANATGTAVATSNWDTNKVNIVYDTAGVAVPVPKGYVASGADGEHTVATGFVIYEGEEEVTNDNVWDESTERNQWVWIPVSDSSRIFASETKAKTYYYFSTYRRLKSSSRGTAEPTILPSYSTERYFSNNSHQGKEQETYYEEVISKFIDTKKSIEKYGGFYIGRYELGDVSENKPVVKRMNEDIASYRNSYEVLSKTKYLAGNNNVKTSLIFGCLWDETLQWLVDTNNKTYGQIYESSSWGNYKDSTFEYQTSYGTVETKESNTSLRIPTGSTEYTKANNIYDLAGNVLEYTMERNDTTDRYWRGGYHVSASSSSNSAQGRISSATPASTGYSYGWRAYMYIQ